MKMKAPLLQHATSRTGHASPAIPSASCTRWCIIRSCHHHCAFVVTTCRICDLLLPCQAHHSTITSPFTAATVTTTIATLAHEHRNLPASDTVTGAKFVNDVFFLLPHPPPHPLCRHFVKTLTATILEAESLDTIDIDIT